MSITLEREHFVEPYEYLIFKEDDLYKAKNGRTLAIDFKDKNPIKVTQSALDALTIGRTWKETVILMGDFVLKKTLKNTLKIPSYTKIDIRGRIYVEDYFDKHVLKGENISYVEICGGIFEGSKTQGVSGEDVCFIFLDGVKHINVHDIIFRNHKGDGVRIEDSVRRNKYIYLRNLRGHDVLSTVAVWGVPGGYMSYYVEAGRCYGYENDVSTVCFNGIRDFSIIGCVGIKNGHEAIKCEGACDRGRVIGNLGFQNNYSGFYTGGFNFGVVKDNVFIDNFGSPDGGSGIDFAQGYFSIIEGNVCQKNGYGTATGDYTGNGISLGGIGAGDVRYCIVRGNLCGGVNAGSQRNKQYGIRVYSTCIGCIVEDNRVVDGGEAGTLLNQSTTTKIKGNIGYVTENCGIATFSGDGFTTVFNTPHGLVDAPTKYGVSPLTPDADASRTITVDATNIIITYTTAPPAGTDNLKFGWWAEV